MRILGQPVEAIIFDMDGLILDNGLLYKTAYQKAAKKMGHHISDELYQQLLGRTHAACEDILRQTFGDTFSTGTFAELLEHCYQDALEKDGVQFRDGFEALFAYLQQSQVVIGLATSSPMEQVQNHLGQTDYLDAFDIIRTINDVKKGKPDPEIYQLTTSQLNVAPDKTIVFEDSNNGMRAAIAAGCLSIMVPNQAPPDKDVEEQAFLVTSSLSDIIPLLT